MYTKASGISKSEFTLIYSCCASGGRKWGGDGREKEKQGERKRQAVRSCKRVPVQRVHLDHGQAVGRKIPCGNLAPFLRVSAHQTTLSPPTQPPRDHDTLTRCIPCKGSFWGLTRTNYIFQRLMCKLRY